MSTNDTSAKTEPQVFEFGDASEWDELVNWANRLDGDGSAIPLGLEVGDILVRRAPGRYQVFSDKNRKKVVTNFDPDELSHIRLSVLGIVSSMPRFSSDVNESVLDLAKKYEEWVTGASDSRSDG